VINGQPLLDREHNTERNSAIVSHLRPKDKVGEGRAKQIDFLLCRSCFWCASQLLVNINVISKCPICYNERIVSFLISASCDEFYKL
jgi:predicted Zn-ribbon and HTH transcriptional regulator